MFERFGEFDSAEEINRAAAAQLKEGDTEAVFGIAEENGIDREDAQDYIDGCCGQLVNPLMAAYGKLDVEAGELHPEDIMGDWLDYIRTKCIEDNNMAEAVRKKGKSLVGCFGALLKWSYDHQRDIDKKILKAAGINQRVTLGEPGSGKAKEIITQYYLGEAEG